MKDAEHSPRFVARAVLNSLAAGNCLEGEVADILNRTPFVDSLRQCVEVDEVRGWILPELDKRLDPRSQGLLLSLLKNYCRDGETAKHLRRQWETAEPLLRAHLLCRILDDQSISMEWHEKLFAFVLDHSQEFVAVSRLFMGSPENAVAGAKERFLNPSYPASKKWVNLCRVALVSSDVEAAHEYMVAVAGSTEDEFIGRVASELDRRFLTQKSSMAE